MRPRLQRKDRVLQAIVEDYVSSHEPVGSQALIARHGLNVSSATVRNDMAVLEEEGMITAPHSSAGRIPTEKGYRYFVDKITVPRPLSSGEQQTVLRLLDSSDSIEELYARTVRILSQLTQQAAILQYPAASLTTVRHLELVPFSEHHMSIILISNSGRVLQKTATVSPYTEQDLLEARTELLQTLVEEPIKNIGSHQDFLSSLNRQLRETLALFARDDESSQLLFAGTFYLAQSTSDFSSSIAPILNALEEQVTMVRLLNEMAEDSRGFSVRIGAETALVPLTETSVVASVYGTQGLSRIGVIGPTRMDYLSIASTVRGVASYLTKILGI